MKKSLFRFADAIELCIEYALCFSLNILFDYAGTLDINSYILEAFLKNFMDYQKLICVLSTFIVIIFHYQMLCRKRTEMFCRMLVGDTAFKIAMRYAGDNLMILGVVYILSMLIDVRMGFGLTANLYLVAIFAAYILVSIFKVGRYD